MPTKDLEQLLVFDKWYGVYTTLPSFNIPDSFVANAKNISFADLSIQPFKQFTQFGNQLTGAGQILAKYTTVKANGAEILLRCRDDTTNSHMEWYNEKNATWETLLPNLTTLKIPSFAEFNTSSQDEVWWCNGTENMTLWTKAIGSIVSNTATTIVLNETPSTQGFKSGGGTVIVNGTEYAYGGYTDGTKTLTGLTALPAFAVNLGVAEAANDSSYSALNKMDILHTADGRMWGAISTKPTLYYSKVGDATNWTASTTPDDPGNRDFVEGQGGITSLSSIKEKIVVFKRDLVQLYWLDYPSSTTRTAQTQEIRRGNDIGAINHQGTIKIGETIYYVTAKGGVKSISLSKQQTDFDFEDITDVIRPSLKNGVFTSAKSIYFEKEKLILIAFKIDSNSTRNDYVVVIEFARDIDGTYKKAISFMDWTVGGWAVYGGNLYFGGSFEPNSFRALDGYDKGGSSIPYTALITTKRFRFSRNPVSQKRIKFLALTGWIGTQKLKFQLQYNYLGTMANLEADFNPITETRFIIQPQLNVIGAFTLGTEPIGGTTDNIDELNYFKIFFTLPLEHHPYDIQLTLYSDAAGARWKIETLGFVVQDANKEIPSTLKKGFKLSS